MVVLALCIGAAGNFLAPISGLSENAFATVIGIDTVRDFLVSALLLYAGCSETYFTNLNFRILSWALIIL